MIFRLSLILINWEKGYEKRSNCINQNISIGRSYTDSSIGIESCFFVRTQQLSGSGGVVYVSGGSYTMSINMTMFHYCTCSAIGGGIYFSSKEVFMNRICANRCGAGNYHHFSLIGSSIDEWSYISVSYCDTMSGYHTMSFYEGNHTVKNMNSSLNKNYYGPGYHPQFTTTDFRFCTISNNIATGALCIHYRHGIAQMMYFNVVNNNSPSYGVVSLYENLATVYIDSCILYGNSDTLFYSSAGPLIIQNSYISHSGTILSGTVTISNNNTYTHIPSIIIHHFSSLYCNADNPITSPCRSPHNTILSTIEYTIKETYFDTPYRSYQEQSFIPYPTPMPTNPPERTECRTFPLDFVERTPFVSDFYSDSTDNIVINRLLFISSVFVFLVIFLILLSFIIYKTINRNDSTLSSSEPSRVIHSHHSKEEKTEAHFQTQNHYVF